MTGTRREQFDKWSGRLGWGVVLVASLLLFFLTNLFPGLSPEAELLAAGWLLFLSLLMLIGTGLLLFRYASFLSTGKGLLLVLLLFIASIRLNLIVPLDAAAEVDGLLARLLTVNISWTLSLLLATPMTLILFMWRRDHSVQLFAVTLFVLVWLLVFYVRLRGAEDMLWDMISGVFPGELLALMCFGQMVFVLAPLFFIGHSVRLLFLELTRGSAVVSPLTTLPPNPSIGE